MRVAWAWSEEVAGGRRHVIERACQALGTPSVQEIGHLCPRCGSAAHGRPFVPGRADLGVSVTRSSGVVAAAVGSEVGMGIDVERVDAVRFSGVGPTLLHADESVSSVLELAVVWTRKEAVLKALGVGLSVDPRAVRLGDAGDDLRVLALPPGYDASRLRLLDLELPNDLVGALAVLVDRPDREISVLAAAAAPARATTSGRGR